MRLAWRTALLLGLVAALTRPAPAADPPRLRIGWVVAGADMVTLMFVKPGLAEHAGKSYVPELIHFEGTSTAMQALATGQLDTASLAYSTVALGIQNAGMADLRVIADEFQDGVPGWHTNEFSVRKDSPFQKIEDLKGKVLASNQTGSAVDIALRAMLSKHGMQDKRDVTIIEVRFPDQKAMLKEGKVDLITAVTPFSFDPELMALARPLFTQRDAIGQSQMVMRVARAGFIDKNRAAMIDFMADYLKALRYFEDPAHHDEIVGYVAQATKRPPEVFKDWVFTKQDYYRDTNGLPNVEALQANVDLQHKIGYLRAPLDIKKHVDLTIVQEAAKRLGAATQ